MTAWRSRSAARAAPLPGALRSAPARAPTVATRSVGCAVRRRPTATVPAGWPVVVFARRAPLPVWPVAAAPVATRHHRGAADCLSPATGAGGAIPVAGWRAANARVAYRPVAIAVAVATLRVAGRCSVPGRCAPPLRLAAGFLPPVARVVRFRRP